VNTPVSSYVLSLEEFIDHIPSSGTRLMGLDIGTKTIGLALGDTIAKVANPLHTLHRKKMTLDKDILLKEIETWGVSGLVVGLPLNMDGTEGPRCQSIRDFLKALTPHLRLPVVLWDERLSTSAVERALIHMDVSRQKRSSVIDAHAAAFILQGVLDRLRFME
jgi:putative holliday junction resolvase